MNLRIGIGIAITLVSLFVGGCSAVVTQPQDTPVQPIFATEPDTNTDYRMYVPSTYSEDQPTPLVITLHGAGMWDSAQKQIAEWRHLAEEKGFIVVAPQLESSWWFRIRRSAWRSDLEQDETAILEILKYVRREYNVASPSRVLLTGFLQGGYPLYFTGCRNAEKFGTIIARDCRTDEKMLENLDLSQKQWNDLRKTVIVVFNGKDGWGDYADHGWAAYRFFRLNKCWEANRQEAEGGQLRRPVRAYEYWVRYQPAMGR